jgi:hypothetical protein
MQGIQNTVQRFAKAAIQQFTNYPKLPGGKSILHSGSVLNDFSDVTLTSPASGQGLLYNGSAWVNGKVGSMTLLASATASNSTSIDFTSGIDSTYDEYVLAGVDINPATDAADLLLRVSEDAGSNWKSGASDYKYSRSLYGISGGAGGGGAATTAIVVASNTSNAAAETVNFVCHFFKPSGTASAKNFQFLPLGYINSGGDYYTQMVSGSYVGTNNAITGVRVLMSSGNITSGSFYLYGVKK